MTANEDSLYGVVDVGGTKIIAGVASAGAILATRRIATMPEDGADAVVRRMAEAIRLARDDAGLSDVPIAGIGTSVPGPNDVKNGVVISSHNVGLYDYPFVERFSAEFGGVAVFIDDDANCAGVGEAHYGAGRRFRDLVYVTISSGIGGAVIIGGALHRGFQAVAGEIGHITVIPGGPLCGCGNRGCIEAVASGPAIARNGAALVAQQRSPILRELASRPEDVTTAMVFDAARLGDPDSIEIVDFVCHCLGIFLADLVHVLNPEAIVMGGGVMAQSEVLIPRLDTLMRTRLYKVQRSGVVLLKADLGESGALFGALDLLLEGLARG